MMASIAVAEPAVYSVRKGDNLTVIARRYGTTVDALRVDNALRSDVIGIGQRLAITTPFARTTGSIRWVRPARRLGEELRPFGPYKKGRVLMPRTGVDVACARGEQVTSPAIGVVRHVGPMDGFGTLLILDHGQGWATVLAPFDPGSVQVAVGEALLAGDRLGEVGDPAEDGPPYLHIELRQNDKAVAPDRLHK